MGDPCSNCGTPLSAEARFCARCGQPVAATSDDSARTDPPPAADAPPDLAAEIRSAPIIGERKPVTALFADVVGSTALAETMDPEDWVALMNRAFDAMSASIQRYGGTITQFSGDAVVAFFGAPVAHEDDPERAVRAALDMLDAVDRLGQELHAAAGIEFRIRIGVNTGPVVVGDIGGDLRHEYTALGDAVNVAARMQAAARPGTALITEDTYRLVAPRVEVTDRGPVAVKGKAEPVHAYEVVRLAAVPGPTRGIRGLHSPMVGREGALRELVGLLDAVLAGRGRMAVVLGEPGIGKTRLLTEVRAQAAARDAAWVETRGLSYGGDLPHHLVVGLVRSLVEAPPGASPDELAAALEAGCRELLGDSWSTPYGYVAHLLALPLEAALAERLEGLDPAALQAHYREALGALLTAAADRRPVVLACEDVHWADPSSVELVGSLLPLVHQVPVLVVCTARPERDVPGWQLVSGAREVFGESLRELRLEPLAPQESRELVAHLLEIESLPEGLRAILLGKTEGNPFFLEEVIRMLIERGVIVRAGTTWVADGVPREVTIPDTVHGLLLARIDRLPDRARNFLRTASVIGREFPVPLLEAVSAHQDGPALGHLGTLEAAGLVDLAGTSPELRYSFRHALVQEAAYGSLLQRQRRELHRRVAEALLRLQPDRRDELSALLAHHYEQAGDLARAAEHLLVAGERALRRFANREALAFFERAASHLPIDSDDREDLRRRVLAGLGRLQAGRTFVPGEDMLRVLDRVLPDAERLGDPELLARAHLANADTRNLMGEWYATSAPLRASLQAARELAESLGDDSLRALPLALIGHGKMLAAEFAEAAELLQEAIPILERRERYAEASMFAGNLSTTYARWGRFGPAEQWQVRAEDLAARSGDPNAVLDAALTRGGLESERGNLREALEATRRGVEEAERIGNTLCSLVGHFMLGDQQLRLGRPGDAIDALERSGELAAYCDAGTFAALSEAWVAAARAQAGEDELDWEEFDRALRLARDNGDRLGEGEVHRQRATALAARPQPDWEQVLADYRAAVDIFERIEATPYLARALRDLGMALEVAGQPERAAEVLRRAHSLLEGMASQARPVTDRPPAVPTP